MKIRASVDSHLAISTFCWLPPDRNLSGCRVDGVAIASSRTRSATARRSSPPRTTVRAHANRAQRGQRHVRRDRELHQRLPDGAGPPGAAPARPDRVARAGDRGPRGRRARSCRRRGGRRRRSSARPRCGRRRRGRRARAPRPGTGRRRRRARTGATGRGREAAAGPRSPRPWAGKISSIARPTIRPIIARLSSSRVGQRGDDPRVLHHRDAVGEIDDLLQAVRDVDHAHAAVTQRADHAEQPVDLLLGQRYGRLVEDQQLHVVDERAGDHHQSLLGRRERPRGPPEIGGQAEALGERPAPAGAARASARGRPSTGNGRRTCSPPPRAPGRATAPAARPRSRG